MTRLVSLLFCIALLPACAGDESASAGASVSSRAPVSQRGVTDLGQEAEKEEEEFRKRELLGGPRAAQK